MLHCTMDFTAPDCTPTLQDRDEHVHVNYLNVLPDKWIDYSWNPLQVDCTICFKVN